MRALPPWLSASAGTDLTQLLAGAKPAARLVAGCRTRDTRRWARRHGLFASFDRAGYIVLSRNAATARRVLQLDGRPGRHTAGLGVLLGYPRCCCRAAARVGDEGIDRLHSRLAKRRFPGCFKLIDPSCYQVGGSVLSHVPCSPVCRASLAIARRIVRC